MSFQNLKSFLVNIPSKYILLLIVLIGFLLRIINLTIGFPILYMSTDEASYHMSALLMLSERSPFTTGNYGPLGAYLQIPLIAFASLVLFITGEIGSIRELEVLIVSREGYFMFIPRILSALFGTLTILATYRLARLLFDKKQIAIVSSLFCALSLNLVFVSHQARAWSPAIFFEMVAIYFSLLAVKDMARFSRYLILAGFFSALSFGFHQFGGLSIILVILISKKIRMPLVMYLKKMMIPIAVFSFLFLIFNFLSLGGKFFSIFIPSSENSNIELVRQGFLRNLSVYYMLNFIKKMFLSDPIIISLFVFFMLGARYRTKIYLPFKIFSLVNLVLSLLIFPPFFRYFLMAFSFWPVFAGKILYDLIWHLRYKYFILTIVVIMASFNSIYFNFLLAQKDTFQQMRGWVDSNVPQQTPIVATSYRNIGYIPVASASAVVRQKKSGYYLKAAKLIDNNYVPNTRFIIYANEVADNGMTKSQATQKALDLSGGKIIIDPYLAGSDRLFDPQNKSSFELLAHFSPTGDKIYSELLPEFYSDPVFLFPFFKIERPGPYFDILRIR